MTSKATRTISIDQLKKGNAAVAELQTLLDEIFAADNVFDPDAAGGDALPPDEDYETGELYEVADRAMDQLPVRTRQLVQLVDVEGFSLPRAAAGVDLEEGPAARELNRGRIHVRGVLDAYLTGR